MSISASQFAIALSGAQRRAKRKYPNQPERGRQMADSECGYYNGPYELEPLTLVQQIQRLINSDAHETE